MYVPCSFLNALVRIHFRKSSNTFDVMTYHTSITAYGMPSFLVKAFACHAVDPGSIPHVGTR